MQGADRDSELIERAQAGNPEELGRLFARYQDRLKRVVRLRLDPRVAGRIDESDVMQEAFLDMQKRFSDYSHQPEMPFYLWMRYLTVQRLAILHRRHVGAAMRGADREVSLHHHAGPAASSISLARFLLGRSAGISKAAMRVEMQTRLQEALNQIDPLDREVLVLRHFEELTNNDVAAILGIQKAAASNRYVRALKRLRRVMESVPGLMVE